MARQPGGLHAADTDENENVGGGDGEAVGSPQMGNRVPVLVKGQTPSKVLGCPCHSCKRVG